MGIIKDGHPTRIAFADAPGILFCEKEVTPPSIDGGGENDTTTMKNTLFRTKDPKKLITLGEASITVSYDSAVYPEIIALVNKNNLITVTFPDGSKLAFFGWLNTFVPGAAVEGAQPTAEITIIASNQDAAGAEIAPVHTPAP